jgi:hypothetical protein
MRNLRNRLSAPEVRALLDYNPNTGVFTWRVKRRGYPQGWKMPGTVAGSVYADGYRHIMINGVSYIASRLAFLWMKGRWPPFRMDHKNRKRSDDRWRNLRPATDMQNQGNKINSNNALGLKGVCYEQDRDKYKAYIEMGGRSVNLGRFDTAEAAHAVYVAAARKYFGRRFARSK